MRKTERLEIRITPEEKITVKNLASSSNMTVSEYLRSCILSSEERLVIVDNQEVRNGFIQIKRAGNNLNQIARAINMHHFYPSLSSELEESLHLLQQASKSCLEFIESLKR